MAMEGLEPSILLMPDTEIKTNINEARLSLGMLCELV